MARDLKFYVGQAVRVARKRKGLTQQELAELVDCTPESISNLERGYRLPSLETLLSVAQHLDSPIAELFEGYEPKRKRDRTRLELEMKLRAICEGLSPRSLRSAVALLKTLLMEEASGS